MNKTTLHIFGRCVSRDVFGFNCEDLNDVPVTEGYEISRYLNGISYLYQPYQNSNQKDIVKLQDFLACFDDYPVKTSRFWLKCLYYNLHKNVLTYFREAECDYFILDNAFASYSYLCLNNGSIITNMQSEQLKYYAKDKDFRIDQSINLSNIPVSDLESMMNEFAQNMKKYFPPERFILLEIKPANIVINKKFASCDLFLPSFSFERVADNFKVCFNLLTKTFPEAHVVKAPAIFIGDANHKWGRNSLHFLEEYYTQYYKKCIDSICHRSGDNLNEILQRFNEYIYDKYKSQIDFAKRNIDFVQLKSFHNTFLVYNMASSLLLNKQNPCMNEFFVYAEFIDAQIALYIIDNNRVFYLQWHEDNSWTLSGKQALYKVAPHGEDRISIALGKNSYLSARREGSVYAQPWTRDWEIFTMKFLLGG